MAIEFRNFGDVSGSTSSIASHLEAFLTTLVKAGVRSYSGEFEGKQVSIVFANQPQAYLDTPIKTFEGEPTNEDDMLYWSVENDPP